MLKTTFALLLLATALEGSVLKSGCTDSCIEAGTSSTCICPISETETVGGCFCDCGFEGGRAGPNDYCYDNDDGQGIWSYAEPKTVLAGCTDSCIAAGTSSTCRCPISETETVGGCFCDCGFEGGRAGPNDYCYDNNDGQGIWSYAEPKTVLAGCTDSCISAGTSSTCRCPISETETVGGCFCDCGFEGGRAGPNDYCYDNNDGQGIWSYAEPKKA